MCKDTVHHFKVKIRVPILYLDQIIYTDLLVGRDQKNKVLGTSNRNELPARRRSTIRESLKS